MLDAFSVHAEGLEAFRTFSNNLPGVDSDHRPTESITGSRPIQGAHIFFE
jgi:hypothetical protein